MTEAYYGSNGSNETSSRDCIVRVCESKPCRNSWEELMANTAGEEAIGPSWIS